MKCLKFFPQKIEKKSMSVNNSSYTYQYRDKGLQDRRAQTMQDSLLLFQKQNKATYTTPQYDEIVRKYMNYDQNQQRITLAVSQGISQNNFSKTVQYQGQQSNQNIDGDIRYNSTTYKTNQNNGNIYQDRFSGLKNVQIKNVQSPDRFYQQDFQGETDKVKRSKKSQDAQITTTNTTYGVSDYQPLFVSYEKPPLSQSNNLSSSKKVIIIENPDIALQNRIAVNTLIQMQNKTESESIQDQNITLCNIF